MKPSPETPLEAYIIAEAAEAAGIPPGVVNLVPSEREAADHLVHNPASTRSASPARPRPASASPKSAAAASRAARWNSAASRPRSCATISRSRPPRSILGNTITVMSGQVCAMLSRAIVSKHRHDELAEAIKGVMQGIKIGNSEEPETQLGPLAMKRQLERVEMYIEEGQARAAPISSPAASARRISTRAISSSRPCSPTSTTPAALPRRRSSARCCA